MNLKDFYAIIDSEKALEEVMIPDLQKLIKRYPFFQAGLFVYIKSLYVTDSDFFSSELQRVSAFIHDRQALFYYVMDDVFKQFYKLTRKPLELDRTNLLINAFFETQDNVDFDIQLEQTISNPNVVSTDYLSIIDSLPDIHIPENVLEDELELIDDEGDSQQIGLFKHSTNEVFGPIIGDVAAKKDLEEGVGIELKHQNLIDDFLSKAQDFDSLKIKMDAPTTEIVEDEENIMSENEETDEELDDDFFFTQTLANIYIKQKKYDRAYEIIKRLSLNYPEKNSYFANQLTFLGKAIKNLKK